MASLLVLQALDSNLYSTANQWRSANLTQMTMCLIFQLGDRCWACLLPGASSTKEGLGTRDLDRRSVFGPRVPLQSASSLGSRS